MLKNQRAKISTNPFAFLLYKLLVLLVMIVLADQVIGNLLAYFYFKQSSGALYRTTFSLEKTTAKVLVFGSSRANHHYHPLLFTKKLKTTFYNTGRDATSILYDLAVFNAVLKRYTPQMVILDLNREAFIKDEISYDKIDDLLPYHRRHPEIMPIIDLKGPFERIKLMSAIYPFNSDLITIAAGNFEFNKLRKGDYMGYVPIYKAWKDTLVSEYVRPKQIDAHKLNAFKEIIHHCHASGIKLIIVCSPYFIRFQNRDRSLMIAEQIANREKISFFDFSADQYFLTHRQLFSDTFHLNNSGAVIFSGRLIDSIGNDKSYNCR